MRMRIKFLSDRSVGVFIRAFCIILLVEVMNEFVVALLLHETGLEFGGIEIHVAKTVVVMAVVLPILLGYLFRDQHKLQHARNNSQRIQNDYYQLFEANPDGVCLTDVDGRFVHANKSFLGFVGHDIQSLRQLPSHPFLTTGNKHRILSKFNLAKSGKSVRFQAVLCDQAGVEHPLEMLYVPKFEETRVVGIHIVLKDISEMIHAAGKLEEARKYLDSLIDNTSDAIIIFKPDTRIIRANHGFESMYGWTEDEVLGKPIPPELFGGRKNEGQHLIDLVLRNKVVASKEAIRYTKDGRSIDVNLTVSPIKDEHGEIIAVAGVSRDISIQKQVVRELQHTTNLLNALFRYAGDAIMLVDARACIVSANPAWVELFGWNVEDVKDQPFSIFRESGRLDEILQGKTCISEEQIIHKRDGRSAYVSVTGSPMYKEDSQEIIGAILIYRDLTDKKQAEASLLKSEKLAVIGELAAGIGHEIRNPLTSIKGFLQMMNTNSHMHHLEILLSEVERISDITNELLLLAKPQADAMRTEDLVGILDEVTEFMRTQADMFRVCIETHYQLRVSKLDCVRNQIKQVFINLIKNAIEAMPNGGWIQVKLTDFQEEVRVQVADTGVGIPEDRVSILGQPFYTTKDRGSGLGLMVSYRIVENHQGSIHVSSEPGRGSRFEVVLPRKQTAVDSDADPLNLQKMV